MSNRRSLRDERDFPSRWRSRSRWRRSLRRRSSSSSKILEARSITEDSEFRRGLRELFSRGPVVAALDRVGGSAKISKGSLGSLSLGRDSVGRPDGRSLGGRGRLDDPRVSREALSVGGRMPRVSEVAGLGLIERFSCGLFSKRSHAQRAIRQKRTRHTKRSRVLLVTSVFSVGENMAALVVIPGADCGDRASVSSRNGFVDLGRSGREELVVEPADGDRARFRKGLLEPKLAVVGDSWSVQQRFTSVSHPTEQRRGQRRHLNSTANKGPPGIPRKTRVSRRLFAHGQGYAPVGDSDTPGGYPSAGGAFMMAR